MFYQFLSQKSLYKHKYLFIFYKMFSLLALYLFCSYKRAIVMRLKQLSQTTFLLSALQMM